MDKKIEKTVDNIIELYESELKITKRALKLMGDFITSNCESCPLPCGSSGDTCTISIRDHFITQAEEE